MNNNTIKIYTKCGFYLIDLKNKIVTNYSESWFNKEYNLEWRDYIKKTYGITKYSDDSNKITTYNTKRIKKQEKDIFEM